MMNIGGAWLGNDRERKPIAISQQSATGHINVCKKAEKVVNSARPILLADIFVVFPFNKLSQAFSAIPVHKRGLRNG
jgi:hypothetical protein